MIIGRERAFIVLLPGYLPYGFISFFSVGCSGCLNLNFLIQKAVHALGAGCISSSTICTRGSWSNSCHRTRRRPGADFF
jgi:hypothetical protein